MPRVQNPGLGAGQSGLLSTVTQLTAAQIRTLFSAPVTVIPAPGAGKIIALISAAFAFHFGSVQYNPATADILNLFFANLDGIGELDGIASLVSAPQSGFGALPGHTQGINVILPGSDNRALVLQSAADLNAGPIVSSTLGAAGLGYAVGDTGTITNGANDATYLVTTVGAGGAVTGYSISGNGSACVVANGNATVDGGAQPGVGVGLTINITAVSLGDGTLKVVTYYQIIAVP
jgi:hypothetical protein